METQFLFFFSALGVFNALLISLYFFFYKKPKSKANFFFGLLLFMFTIRVGKSVFFYFNEELSNIYIKIGLSACILIGPSLYFYIKSVAEPQNKMSLWPLHYVVLLAITTIIGVSFPETFNPKIFGLWWLTIIYWVWLVYIIASGFVLKDSMKRLFSKTKKLNSLDFWLLSIFIGNIIVWTAYNMVPYTSYIVGALSFSFIFYLMFLLIHFNRKKGAIFNDKEKYSNKKIETDEANILIEKLSHIMVSEKPYINANVKLKDVAKQLGVIPHRLSQLLNDNLEKSFTNFVNEYRIQDAKNLIDSDSNLTFEAIGYECGFNSKSTFYTAFKKHSGLTPAQYRAKK